MPITVNKKKYTGEELSFLTVQFGVINPEIGQILTRYDFQNRKFGTLDDLGRSVMGDMMTKGSMAGGKNLSPDAFVKKAVDDGLDIAVMLVRGTTAESAAKCLREASAGGVKRDPLCGKPGSTTVLSQVGGSQSGIKREKVPEFTAVFGNSESWAKRGGWLYVQINTKYLVRGDTGQAGWVCLHAAPLLAAQFVPHPSPVPNWLPDAD